VSSGTEPTYDHDAIDAIIRAYVACRLALDALPRLPDELKAVLTEPIKTLCDTLGPALERVKGD
jgi:hypothetical protein